MPKNSFNRTIYKNAPIIEAIIDLKFKCVTDFDFSTLDNSVRDKYLIDYPTVMKETQNEFRFNEGANPQQNPIVTNVGLRFRSSDEKQILRVRTDGFTFSRLSPYQQWEPFRDEAKRLLEIYQKATSPENIIRTAVRFINRLDLPGNSVTLADYLKIFPVAPQDYKMNGLAMQLVLEQEDIKSTLIVREALIPPTKPNVVSLLLDFDLFHQEPLDFNNLWSFLEKLHLRKNKIFESAITDKTRELIS